MYFKLKRSLSLGNMRTTHSSTPSKLLWSPWVDISFAKYLNLMDFEYKQKSIPWFHIPFEEDDVVRYCLRTIFSNYKPVMVKKFAYCGDEELHILIHQLLHVSKLFNIVDDGVEAACLYYNIANSLFDRGKPEPSLFLTLWESVCVNDRVKMAVLSGMIGKHRKRRSARLLQYILENAHFVQFDFWGAWGEQNNIEGLKYCPLTASLLNGNLNQMRILIQYGFEPNSRRLYTYDKHFNHCVNYIYDWLRAPLLEEGLERRKCITEVLLFLLNAAGFRSKAWRAELFQGFRLMWNTITTPYVTKKELMNEVRERFLNPPNYRRYTHLPNTEKEFLRLCESYSEVFINGGSINIEPRSLKHLSRCSIRKQLQSIWNLPSGIDYLYLPNHLKSYLNIEMEF